jgi:hypothetical protein
VIPLEGNSAETRATLTKARGLSNNEWRKTSALHEIYVELRPALSLNVASLDWLANDPT